MLPFNAALRGKAEGDLMRYYSESSHTPNQNERYGLHDIASHTRRLNLLLGVLAVVVILGSFSVLAYNTFNDRSTDTITVNGKVYSYSELFSRFPHKTMNGYEGVGLSDLVNDTGLEEPEGYQYRLIGSDGYEKTVDWSDMEKGIIRLDRTSYFPDLPRQFYVKNLVEIEVI